VIAVIDYGSGNLRSVVNAFEALNQRPVVTNNPSDVAKASAIVLPGVGAFGECMESLKHLNLVEPLNEAVLGQKKPYLGICLGLQLLGEESFEQGVHKGLGWIRGRVKPILPNHKKFRIPHMGWNDVSFKETCPLFQGMNEAPVFYFVHSYQLSVEEKEDDIITATCWHGTTVTASVQKENIFAVQFHPEKSQENGIKLLDNFVKIL